MFRDVPEYSGMFHVPGFIDARFQPAFSLKIHLVLISRLQTTIRDWEQTRKDSFVVNKLSVSPETE